MRTLGERIREARKAVGLNQTQLGKLIGVRQSAVAHWEKGDKSPSLDNLELLSAHLKRSPNWFLQNTQSTDSSSQDIAVRPLDKRFAPVDRRKELALYHREKSDAAIAVPTWLNAAAGPGCFLELSDDYYYVPKLSRSRGIHMAVIRGESMKETLSPGDTIVMRSFADRGLVMPPLRYGAPKGSMQEWRNKIRDNGIYALSINHEGVTIKRVLFQGQEPDWYVVIEADNRNEWEPRTIRLGDEVCFFAEVLGLAQD